MNEEINHLAERCKGGDLRAFEKIFALLNSRVSGIIYHMLGKDKGDTDDLVQEVFIKAYRSITRFREEAGFPTWIYRITVNTVWDYLRKKKRRKTVSTEETGDIYARVKNTDTELNTLMNKEIQKLPLKYKTTLILKDIEGMPYKEIAAVMHCRIGTVESRLFRARCVLKKLLDRSGWWRDFL